MSSPGASRGRVLIEAPPLVSGGAAVTLVQWLVDPGMTVHEGDHVAELLVAGVLFHVASPIEGRMHSRTRRAGAMVRAGDVLGWIEPAPEDDDES